MMNKNISFFGSVVYEKGSDEKVVGKGIKLNFYFINSDLQKFCYQRDRGAEH